MKTRIILVEDERLIAKSMSVFLENAGYEVVAIFDRGEDVLQAVKTIKVDLILMDIYLKGDIDGIEAAREIKKISATPVVFVTAYADQDVLERAISVSPYGYITKPVDPDTLFTSIEVALYRSGFDQQLQESEDRYKTLFNSIAIGIIIIDAQSHEIYQLNPKAAEMIGAPEKDILGKTCHELICPGPGSRCPALDSRVRIENAERILITASGQEKPVLTSVDTIVVNNRTMLLESLIDISELKETQYALLESMERSERLIENALMGIGITDLDENLTFVNQHFVEMLGYTRQEMEGMSLSGLTCPEQYDVMQRKTKSRKGGGSDVYEIRMKHKNGGELDVLLNASPLRDHTGAVIGTIGMMLDITERKRAELAVRQAYDETDQILNTSVDGIRVIDTSFTIIRVNRTYLDLTGVESEAAVLGKKCYEVLACSLCHTLQCPIFRMQGEQKQLSYDLQMQTAGGRAFPANLHIAPFYSEENTLIGIVTSIRDTSERRLLEAQLAHAQKMEAIGGLAAGIAHEINTPSQYVGDNTRFLQDAFSDLLNLYVQYQQFFQAAKTGTIDKAQIAELEQSVEQADVAFLLDEVPRAIEQSLEGIQRITHIVSAMKDFSHPGSKEKSCIDINKSIETTITVAKNEWKYVADIKTELDPDLPQVPCLQDAFNQVILNMITNAAHAIAEVLDGSEKKKGEISIRTSYTQGHAVISIGDTGCGIPVEARSKIYEPFFTTKPVGKGTGQGLAISYDVIVNKHNGTLDVASETGKGTTFTITLPLSGDVQAAGANTAARL